MMLYTPLSAVAASITSTTSNWVEDVDFNEGVKDVYDSTHPDFTSPVNGNDIIPTHLCPY